jgi:hypothetical protein
MVGGIGASGAHAIAARGITDCLSRIDAAARRTVEAGPEVEDMVEMKLAAAQVKASAAAVRTVDGLTGTLIDALA